MIRDPVRRVITLLGAVAPDGGHAVVSAFAAELARLAPFDEGELVLTLAADAHRRPLTPQSGPLIAEDVLTRLAERHGVVRIEDAQATQQHERTREQLARRQLRSLLAVPIVLGGAVRGALAIAARRPGGFTDAPTQTLLPLANAAGLALTHALKLSGLRDEQDHLRQEVRRLSAALAEREQSAFQARCESEAREAEREAMRRALEELRRGEETRSSAAGTPGANGPQRR
jgi:transcriptional regulator with GAF, ATPase, and Fis domain